MAAVNGVPTPAQCAVYVPSAGTGELRMLTLDTRTGALSERQCLLLGGGLMPMALNPQRTRLYVARRSAPMAVLSLAIGSDGRLTLLGESPLPVSMAYIATDRSGRFLFSASYGEHQLAVSPHRRCRRCRWRAAGRSHRAERACDTGRSVQPPCAGTVPRR